jgi:FtsJ-like methyltransferase
MSIFHISLKAKDITSTNGMDHPNVARAPPWLGWTGGPTVEKLPYSINSEKDESPLYEQWLCSLTLTNTHEVKNRIGLIYNQAIWDDFKKITNPYEYVFLSLNRRMSRSVASRIPLSRSYFKMLELWLGLDMERELETLIARTGGLISTHAAEGPGGFIEAIHDALPGKVKYTQAITLRSTTKNIPGWRKTAAFLSKHPEINITYGQDDTGDLLKIENLDNFIQRLGTKAHIYTADGGFDFSSDFNAQEETILPLLTAEFYLGLKSIQQGGLILVKIFDTTLRPTLELLWIVTRAFREWTIVKPRTSRGGNAERYLVCKGFLGLDDDMDAFFRKAITTWSSGATIQSFLGIKPDKEWLQIMLTLQESIAHQESEIIENTLLLIEKPIEATIRAYIEQNVERSIQWCIEHKEPTNQKWQDTEWRQKTIADEIRGIVL